LKYCVVDLLFLGPFLFVTNYKNLATCNNVDRFVFLKETWLLSRKFSLSLQKQILYYYKTFSKRPAALHKNSFTSYHFLSEVSLYLSWYRVAKWKRRTSRLIFKV